MNIDSSSSNPQIDATPATLKNCLEVFLSQICGECTPLRPVMLTGLLVLVTESDWALSTIPDVDYIKPLEEYCEQTKPCEVSISLPQLISFIDRKLSVVVDFHSSIVFLLPRPPQIRLSFSPSLEVSKMALKALHTRCNRDFGTLFFLRTHSVPFDSTDRSSELVPFVGRLCSTLAEHVSEMKSLFAESSHFDATISALAVTLPEESPLFTRNLLFEMLCDGFSLLNSLLVNSIKAFQRTLIGCHFVPLLKSTIIACLDLLDHARSESNYPPADQTDMLIFILDSSWNCASDCLCAGRESLHPVVRSAFSDDPQLCSLLERTCSHFSPSQTSYLRMIINLTCDLPHLIPRLLEENLVERVLTTSKPMAVPTAPGQFHLRLIWAINNLLWNPKSITPNEEGQTMIRMLQFKRVLTPAKQYLQFILQREEFILNEVSSDKNLPSIVTNLLDETLALERVLFAVGEIVETGREEWEVGWLVEKANDNELGEKLNVIRKDDEKLKKDEKARWKKRVERRREAGNEDAMEGWLTRMDYRTRFEIVGYLRCVNQENGMNWRF
ncbi:hypothetical protein BLNAU_17375 [Blattamonas nauphoetae]|uniref:Uncharacterized protein n=1 Tax=Blattamonas nauphoetae TaxID=2049346 RepID=A0ABQ9X8S9_9EUKA|nr:hypothetical protein BLNAU_17375 [Blattamonas nauphoetae]